MAGTRIIGSTAALESFLAEWEADVPTIEVHTSGSTGKPKTIHLSKADMLTSAAATCRQFGIGSGSVLALPLSVDYIAGKMMVVRALVSGAKLYVEQPSSRPFASLPHGLSVDLASIVPAQVGATIDAVRDGAISFGALMVGGAPVSEAAERALGSIVPASYATYGMTETCSNVALRRFGQPLYMANEGVSFSVDHRSCLVVSAPSMSFGELVTNDVVELCGPYAFRWVGRADNVVNSGGVKLFPEEIERKINMFLPAETFFVVGRASERWGSEIVAVVEKLHAPDPALRRAIEQSLGRYERPKEWIVVDALPRTSTGKLLRRLL